eukprot:654738_1
MIILGTDSMKLLQMGMVRLDEIKQLIWNDRHRSAVHFNKKTHPINLLSDDNVDAWWEQHSYRHEGDPGIYKVASDGKVSVFDSKEKGVPCMMMKQWRAFDQHSASTDTKSGSLIGSSCIDVIKPS